MATGAAAAAAQLWQRVSQAGRHPEQLKSGLNAFSVSLSPSVCFGFFLQANPALQMPERCANEAACPCLLCCCCCSLICLLWLRLDRSQFDFSLAPVRTGAALFRLQHEFICFEIVTRHPQEPKRERKAKYHHWQLPLPGAACALIVRFR